MSYSKPLYTQSYIGGNGTIGPTGQIGPTGPTGADSYVTGPTGQPGPISNSGGLNLYFNASETPPTAENQNLLKSFNPYGDTALMVRYLSPILVIDPTPITVDISANQTNTLSNLFSGGPITNINNVPPGPFNMFIYASSTDTCYIQAIGYIVTISDGSLNQIFNISTDTINNTTITLYNLT